MAASQAEKINKANEARLHAADEKKAKGLVNIKDKVCVEPHTCLLTTVSGV